MNATIPFSILEMLIAHQTPVMPSPIAVNPIAIGIRRLLNVMLMMAGGSVRPVPYNNPCFVISRIMNNIE